VTNGAKVVPLGARAMDILIVLVEQANTVVGGRALIERVWPKRGAEQVSLRVYISALRKALDQSDPGKRYIANVPGRGYSFVVPVREVPAPASGDVKPSSRSGLPARLMRMLGRSEALAAILAKIAEQKSVTILGPGGIGKTTVAVAVAHEMSAIFDGRIHFVDLSALGGVSLVAPAVATALGVSVQTDNVVPALIDHLRERPTLIILDCCEHLIDGAAALAEELICRVPTLHLLATSREVMRVEGEHVYELSTLACPPEDGGLSAHDVLQYPAVQLLVDRARAVRDDFELADADAPVAAGICRRLDGIPLAIELAAGRVDIFGLSKTASLLDDRLNLSWVGRRTALPKHQTLNAALEWSYDLLDDAQKRVLGRLSVFAGGFTLEAAGAVVADELMDEANVCDCVWELRSKSMIAPRRQEGQLRLLDTTLAFASRRLANGNEKNQCRRRHALYFRGLFQQGASIAVPERLRALGSEVDNLRAALNWAFSIEGDAKIGVELAAASASTWMAMGLLAECREWMTKAIGRLDDASAGTRQEMIMQSALASCMMFTDGMTTETYAGWDKTRLLAESLNDIECQIDSLLVLWAHQIRIPGYAKATELADRCGDVAEASGDRGAVAMADYMRGVTYTLGEYCRPKLISNCPCIAMVKRPGNLSSSGSATIGKSTLFLCWPTWPGSGAVPIRRGVSTRWRSPRHANWISRYRSVWRWPGQASTPTWQARTIPRRKRLPTNLSTTPQNMPWKAITAWALAFRLSVESGAASAMQLRRRCTAVWRSCRRRDMGSSTGSCKQSSPDLRPSPVGRGKDLLFSNGRKSISMRSNGTRRNCVGSGANSRWPMTRGSRLPDIIFSVRSNCRTDKRACRGRSGRRPAWPSPKGRPGETPPRGELCKLPTRNFGKVLRPAICGWPGRC
jgi:predicted ATPase/DNA-binding winged helix-turn-helix (wHTH) protein